MKTIAKKLSAAIAMIAICFGLFSFSSPWGGEGFEIFLNNKLVSQQFGKEVNNTKSLQLDQRYANDELTIKYYHCGQPGKNREITLRDGNNNVLKDWRFDNASANETAGMDCPVKDILAAQKRSSNGTLNLYYSSTEIPQGKLLMTIVK